MPEVRYTAEVDRILKLPRRAQGVDPAHVHEMTEALRTDAGTMKLRPVQVAALLEAMTVGGIFGPIGVGEGKTLITLLLPYVLEAERYLLLLPANLIEKTKREHAKYAREFHLPKLGEITLLSYELLGRVQAEKTLERVNPDLIGADEVHKLKNRGAACTKRVIRHMQAAPTTKFAGFSGTVMQKSVRDFSHILRWCLKDGAPVPKTVAETEDWAYALDEKIDAECRFGAGALLKLCNEAELREDQITAARRGFRRRLVETPGVVSTIGEGEEVNASIYVSPKRPTYKPIIDEHFLKLRKHYKTPDDWELLTGAEVWGCARQLALGFHYVWDPRPPDWWRIPRRDWYSFAREVLSRSRTLDSELHVALAVDAGKVQDGGLLARWRAVRDKFKPNTKAIWHDDSVLTLCAEWMEKNPDGIVWADHTAFGERLAKVTGRKYFGKEGYSADRQFIDDATGPIIASIKANKEGRNLQYKWCKNLVTAFPDNADLAEQMIGRTHRPKQEADEVTFEVILGCYEHANAFRKAMIGAQTIRDTVGAAQKLLIADVTDWPEEDEIATWRGPRWVRQICDDSNTFAATTL